jgi:hypothetical protein
MDWKAAVRLGAILAGLVGGGSTPAVGASGWVLPPVQLAAPAAGTSNPAVAMDAAGDAVAVWTVPVQGGEVSVVARSRPAGGDWSAPEPISTGLSAGAASVAIDAHGNATAVWIAGTDLIAPRVRAAELPAGSTAWGAVHDFPHAGDVQPLARLAVNAGGEAVATWVELDSGSSVYAVRAAVRDPGGTWGAPATVSDPAGFSAESFGVPQATIDADGTAVVAWTAQDNGPAYASHVQQATYAGGAWSTAQDLASSANVIDPVALAGDGAGGAVAAWREEGPYSVSAALRSGGAWAPAEQLSTDVAPTCTAVLAVAAGAPGPTVAWEDGASGVAARTHGAGGWGAPATLFTPPADTAVGGIGLAGGAGGTAAAWSTIDAVSGAAGVQGARADATGAWDPATPLASATDGSSFATPALTADGAGNALAAWAETDPVGDVAPVVASYRAPPPPSPPPPQGTTTAPSTTTAPAPHALPRLLAPLLSLRGGTLRLAPGARTLVLRLVNRDALALRGSARLTYLHRRGTHGPTGTLALQRGVYVRAHGRSLLHLRLSVAALHRLRAAKGHAQRVVLTLRLRAADGRLVQTTTTYLLSADVGPTHRGARGAAHGLRLTLRPWRPRPRARIAC